MIDGARFDRLMLFEARARGRQGTSSSDSESADS
jgi:hypothetical protein